MRCGLTTALCVATLSGQSIPASAADWVDYATVSMTDPVTPKLTNRHLCFTDGTDVLCESPSPYLTSGGLLGIGTTNPQTALEVSGTVSATAFVGDGSGLTNLSASGDRITSGTSHVIVSDSAGVTIRTNGADRLTVNSSGNVGIGTTAPTAQLDIFKYTAAVQGGPVIRLTRDYAGNDYGSAIYSGWNGMRDILVFGVGQNEDPAAAGQERMVIRSNGNVGIGTITPTATLQVSGSFTVSTTAQTTTPSLYVGANGRVGIGTDSPGKQFEVAGTAGVATVRLQGAKSDPNYYTDLQQFYSTNGFTITQYTFGQSSTVVTLKGGNVGISTTSPNAKLDVYGTISATNILAANIVTATYFEGDGSRLTGIASGTADNLGNHTATQALDMAGYAINAAGTVSGTAFYSGDGNAYFYNNGSIPSLVFDTNDYFRFTRSANTLDWLVGGNAKFTVDSTGKLGVLGNGDPQAAVDATGGTVSATTFYGSNGSVSVPAYSFSNDTNSGIYRAAAAVLGFSVGSANVVSMSAEGIGSTGLAVAGHVTATGVVSASGFVIGAGTPNALGGIRYSATSDTLQVYTGSGWKSLVSVTTVAGSTSAASSTGAIQFNSGNSFAGDTSNLFWDDANNQLGIGTSSPQSALHVSASTIDIGGTGTSSIELGRLSYGNQYSYIDFVGDDTYTDFGLRIIRNNTGANAGSTIQHRGTGNLTLYTSEPAPIVFSTSSSERVRITDEGDVGIGVATPSSKLHIKGATSNIYLGDTLEGFGSGTNLSGGIYFGSWGGTASHTTAGIEASWGDATLPQIHIGTLRGTTLSPTYMSAYYTGLLTFSTLNSERMRINSSGNVGIGTVTPTAKLAVNGDVSVTGVIDVGHTALACSTTISGSIRYETTSDTLQICTSAGWKSLSSATTVAGSSSAASSTGAIQFNSGNSFAGDANNLFWDDANNRLGIGTSVPGWGLEVSRTTSSADGIIIRNLSTNSNASAQVRMYASGALGSGSIGVTGANYTALPILTSRTFIDAGTYYNGVAINTETTTPIVFGTNSTERGRFDGSGNLGIGTQSPTATLEVSGSFTVSTSTQTTTPSLYVGTNGNVGIGTNAPGSTLDVKTDTTSTYFRLTSQNTHTRLRNVDGGAGNDGLMDISPIPATEADGSYIRMFRDTSTTDAVQLLILQGNGSVNANTILGGNINSYLNALSGNVGIGKIAPTAKLDVTGNVSVSGIIDVGHTALACSTTISGSIRYETTSDTLQICTGSGWKSLASTTIPSTVDGAGSTNHVAYWSDANSLTYDSSQLYWDATNNRLGIGTGSPAYVLDVRGGQLVSGSSAGYYVADRTTGVSVSAIYRQGAVTRLWDNVAGDVIAYTSASKVGIGTTAPNAKLEVNGAVSATVHYANDGDTAAAPGFAWGLDTNTGMYHPAADVIGWSINSTEKMRLGTTGLGINAAPSTQTLYLVTTTTVAGSYSGIQGAFSHTPSTAPSSVTSRGVYVINDYASANTATNSSMRGGEIYARKTAAGSISGTYGLLAYAQGSGGGAMTTGVGVYGFTSVSDSTTASSLYGVQGYTYDYNGAGVGGVTNAYSLYAQGSSNAGRMTNYYGLYINNFSGIDPSGNFYGVYVADSAMDNYFAGNVGIGTTAPTTALDVIGTISASSNIRNGGFDFTIGTTDQTTRGNSGASRALVKNAGAQLAVNYSGDFTGGTAIMGSGSTNLFVSGASNGNVGIGTTNPNAKVDVNGTVSATTIIAAPPMMIVADEKAAATAGGTATSGAWQTRTLNTVNLNTITGASLASNQITLPAGTYVIRASAPAYDVNRHQARLYNATDAVVAIDGTSEYANSSYGGANRSFVTGQVSIAASKAFRLEHRVNTTVSGNGFGVESNLGSTETYSTIEITKIH